MKTPMLTPEEGAQVYRAQRGLVPAPVSIHNLLEIIYRITAEPTPTPARHDPKTGPCPTCGFHLVVKPYVPFVFDDDEEVGPKPEAAPQAGPTREGE